MAFYFQIHVSFVDNGADAPVSNQVVNEGSLATQPIVSKTGYSLVGWYTEAEFTNEFDFATETIIANITLYAKWEENTSGSLMIYEIYGAGGNSGAYYKNDYVVLHNSTNAAIDLSGYSIQYASSTGTSWSVTNLSGNIAAGGFYFIKLAGGTVGLELPINANVTGTINLAGTSGKVALLNSTTKLTVSNPVGSEGVIDFVGYGTANAYEGTGPAPAPSTTSSIRRKTSVDGNDNKNDFEVITLDSTSLDYLK
jgi:uncharacterized repeat protein (TIGR02543 family)